MSAVLDAGRAVARHKARKWKRRAWLLVALLIFGIAVAVGLAIGLPAAADAATERAGQMVHEAVTPDLPDFDWTPVVDTRDQIAEWVDSLPPPQLIEQRARELIGADQ